MMYVDFEAGNNAYKLRLNIRNIVMLEKQIGCNPLMIFGSRSDRVPTVTEMIAILNASLQPFHHGITTDKAYDIFATWLNDGHQPTDFISVIIDIYRASGIMKPESAPNVDGEDTEDEEEKN